MIPQIGTTSAEKHLLERTARQDAKVKSALAKRIAELEQTMIVRKVFMH
jgi:hypothetical protein